MAAIDWLIVLLYLLLTLGLGLYLSGKASEGLEAFFVSGRSLPWWLSGTSMAATTFSIDTPLYIAGVVASRGVSGNWEWWSFGIAHVVMIYIFARMWRRSGVVTDAQLTEIRYGGSMAAILRAVKAFLFAVPINCIGIGYAMLAMVKVIDALELWQSLGIEPGENLKLWSVVGVSLFVLFYAGISGLWGVVATDFFQFFLGLFGAIAVAAIAVSHVGGIYELIPLVQEQTDTDILAFLPLNTETASLSLSTFGAYLLIQWWAFRRSDGGGEFIQRLLASKNEAEAEKAAWFFNILHYVVRTWPWILVALVALVVYPNLEDRELGYPKLMLDFLPPAMLGLVVASLLAAFMSTVSTSINWGASYLTNDLYLRFFRPESTQSELVLVGRMSSIMVTVLGAIAAFYAQDVATVFRLVIAIGTGPGLVLILRWFWWRINAAAELASMVGGFVVGLTTSVVPILTIQDFGLRLLVTAGISGICWIAAMLLTAPESDQTLDEFYRLVRPGGPGWRRQRSRTGLKPAQSLPQDLLKVSAAILLLFGAMFAVGGFLLLNQGVGWMSLIVAVAGAMMLRYVSKLRVAPMARPGLEDEL
ncbi:Na+:solute symporter [Roseofilum reptotaenium CS-1145]|uniref:Sodium:proline symporter n=1 Tax=Roseofilum reptotaenium AO1-A TaxID=1925591 RepID=A0A1L9QNR6_9CYAN|nr:sodium:solute symporter family protein [Roseofilum reptotaenium]MDB9520036.1 Na+:solute symporter [Roseofilum reptotaenium CS-1145]OJJ24311.1 sodium:proline symporter [Roseofilum reptotaenium AO1-A]